MANGDLTKKITVDVQGEILELKNTINTMVDQLNSFASEVTRVAREVGTEGKLGGQAQVTGVAGMWKDLTDNVNSMAGNLTSQVRGIAKVVTAVANGDLKQKLRVEAKGEIADPGRHHQRHDRHAGHLRRPGDQRGPRGGHRRQAGRPGPRAGRRRHLARPHRQREPARRQPDHPGPRHRRRGHRGDQGRPDAVHRGGGAGRGGGAQGQHQRDDPQPARHHAQEHGAGLAQDQPGQVQPHAAGPARPGGGVAAHPLRPGAAGHRPPRRVLRGGQRRRDADAQAARQMADLKGLDFEVDSTPRCRRRCRPTPSGCSRCSRTCSPTPSSSPSGAACRSRPRWRPRAGTRSRRCSTPPTRWSRSRVQRHRHRHPEGEARRHLRGVPAGRHRHQPQVRRHRPGPLDQPADHPPPGRRDPDRERAGRGQHLHPVPAGHLSRGAGRGLAPVETEGQAELRPRLESAKPVLTASSRVVLAPVVERAISDDRSVDRGGRPDPPHRGGRSQLRPDPARSGARPGLQGPGGPTAPTGRSRWPASTSRPRSRSTSGCPTPTGGPSSTGSSTTRPPGTFRCTSSRSRRTGSAASGSARSTS